MIVIPIHPRNEGVPRRKIETRRPTSPIEKTLLFLSGALFCFIYQQLKLPFNNYASSDISFAGMVSTTETGGLQNCTINNIIQKKNIDIVQKAPLINPTHTPRKQVPTATFLGARRTNTDAYGTYVPDVTSFHLNPPPFDWTEEDTRKFCRPMDNDDMDYFALDRIRISKPFLERQDSCLKDTDRKPVKILCTIYSSEGSHHKIPEILQTWGHRCDGFMVGSNATDERIGAVDIYKEGTEEYLNMWQKVRSIWAFIYDNYYDDFDWFHIGGDDMWIIVENLRAYLESDEIIVASNGGLLVPREDKMQVPLYLGLPVADGPTRRINIGGPGYTINKAALKLLATQGLPVFKPHRRTSTEDSTIGQLFDSFNVSPYFTDDFGRRRYHHWGPGREWAGQEALFFRKVTKELGYIQGRESLARYSFAFHYLNRYDPDQLRRLHALTYGPCNSPIIERPYGTFSSPILPRPHPSTSNSDVKVRVACVIYSYHGGRELIAESFETWGKHCDTFDAYSDEEYVYSNPPSLKTTIRVREPPAPKRTLWNTVKRMWRDLADRYDNGTLDADYVTFSGDDAFFVLPNLRLYLSRFEKGKYYYLGGVDSKTRNTDFPWVGGAGYVISRQLIVDRVLDKCPDKMAMEEDVLTSKCLYANGVNFTDTRDSANFDRFCREKPGQSCGGRGDKDEPSKEVVLFHYVKSHMRAWLHDNYYGVNQV